MTNTTKSQYSRSFTHLLVATLISVQVAGCADDTGMPEAEEEEGETGCIPEHAPIELEDCSTIRELVEPDGASCTPCYEECNSAYWCFNSNGTQPIGGCPICASSQEAADNICQSEDFLNNTGAYAQLQPCYLPLSCTGWDPPNEVSAGPPYPYEVSQAFIDSVIADPTLLKCDSARFEYDPGDQAFVLSGVTTGGLLYELGFLNGDIPLEVNGHSVQTAAEVIGAFVVLFVTEPSSYTIEVHRGSSSVFIYVDVT